MYKITAWNRTSPDFGANNFIAINGTNGFNVDDKRAAMVIMNNVINDKRVEKAVLDSPEGRLTWHRVSIETKECDA